MGDRALDVVALIENRGRDRPQTDFTVTDPMKRLWLLVAYDLVFIHDTFSSPRTYSGCGIKGRKIGSESTITTHATQFCACQARPSASCCHKRRGDTC
jgi:hypothetical protein